MLIFVGICSDVLMEFAEIQRYNLKILHVTRGKRVFFSLSCDSLLEVDRDKCNVCCLWEMWFQRGEPDHQAW